MAKGNNSGFSVTNGKKVCSVCGKVKKESYFINDGDRCNDCTEKMLRTKIKWYCIPIALVFAIASVIACYMTVVTLPIIKGAQSAEKAVSEVRLYEALDIYKSEVIDKADNIDTQIREKLNIFENNKLFVSGTKTFERYCEICAMADSEYEAGALAKELFDKNYIKSNEVFSGYVSAMDAYDKILAKVQAINEKYNFDSVENFDCDKIIADIEKEKQNASSDYEKGFCEYFKATATLYRFKTEKEVVSKIKPYLDEMIQYLPGEYGVYGSTMFSAAMSCEDYDSAIEAANFIIQKNKNITEAYEWLCEAYYKKGDTEKVFAALEQLGEFSSSSPTYYKLLIKYNLLKGDMKTAEQAFTDGCNANAEIADEVFNKFLAKDDSSITKKENRIFAENIEFNLYWSALLLLQGDAETAFEIAYDDAFYQAYYYAYLTGDYSLLSQGVINMATLCAKLCNDTTALEDISQCGPCDEATQKVINGELTLEDVFINGKAEIL